MEEPTRDEVREERIMMEIVVDAYGPEEQAMGWYYYLEGQLQFPFLAHCIASPSAPFHRSESAMRSRSLAWHPKTNASTRCSC